jgi:hypothetical protein
MKISPYLAVPVLFWIACGVSRAGDVQVILDFPSLIASPGQTFTFTGYLVNNDSQLIYLNGCNLNMAGQFTTDCNGSFMVEAPLYLDALATSPDFDMFTATVNAPYTDAYGPQAGSFDVLGGPGAGDNNLLGTALFTVDVEVPEPAPRWPIAIAAACVLFFAYRAKPSNRLRLDRIVTSCATPDTEPRV